MNTNEHLNYIIERATEQGKSPDWIHKMVVKYVKGAEYHGGNLTSMSDKQLKEELFSEELDAWVYNEELKRRGLQPRRSGKVVICDLDGTLCDTSHREHLFHEKPVKWEKVWSGVFKDKVNDFVLDILKGQYSKGHDIVYLTGRSEKCRADTEEWLKQTGLPYKLLMRPENDWTDDLSYKTKIIKDIKDIVLILEDRPHIVEGFRKLGHKVIDVGNGKDFRLEYEK